MAFCRLEGSVSPLTRTCRVERNWMRSRSAASARAFVAAASRCIYPDKQSFVRKLSTYSTRVATDSTATTHHSPSFLAASTLPPQELHCYSGNVTATADCYCPEYDLFVVGHVCSFGLGKGGKTASQVPVGIPKSHAWGCSPFLNRYTNSEAATTTPQTQSMVVRNLILYCSIVTAAPYRVKQPPRVVSQLHTPWFLPRCATAIGGLRGRAG
jgi:hypothetical protein